MLSSVTRLPRETPVNIDHLESPISGAENHIQIERLIPVRVQGLFNDGGGVGLLASNRSHSEWVGES